MRSLLRSACERASSARARKDSGSSRLVSSAAAEGRGAGLEVVLATLCCCRNPTDFGTGVLAACSFSAAEASRLGPWEFCVNVPAPSCAGVADWRCSVGDSALAAAAGEGAGAGSTGTGFSAPVIKGELVGLAKANSGSFAWVLELEVLVCTRLKAAKMRAVTEVRTTPKGTISCQGFVPDHRTSASSVSARRLRPNGCRSRPFIAAPKNYTADWPFFKAAHFDRSEKRAFMRRDPCVALRQIAQKSEPPRIIMWRND